MKTCVKYWGGKQQLAPKIIPLIPKHKCYVEPFFGGGAVFFEKPPSKVEVINDINDNMINFYRVVKGAKTFEQLWGEIDLTLYSEWQYKQAKDIWKRGKGDDHVMRAWAVFLLAHQSFSGNMASGWAFSDGRNMAKWFDNVKKNFDEKYLKRLEYTQIFCRDALNVIKNTQSDDTFYFVDPPYFNADMGHYGGYSQNDFWQLLKYLASVKGKFLMTTYPSDILTDYTGNCGWNTIDNVMHRSAGHKSGVNKNEVFTMNYDPNDMR